MGNYLISLQITNSVAALALSVVMFFRTQASLSFVYGPENEFLKFIKFAYIFRIFLSCRLCSFSVVYLDIS